MRHLPLLFLLLLASLARADAPDTVTVALPDGSEIPILHYPGAGDRLLWIPAEYGLRGEAHRAIAAGLAAAGLDVWLADLHAAWFLIPGRSSYTGVDPAAVADLIERARPRHGRLYIASAGRGAALLLMAAREWRLAHPQAAPLGGAVLLHPNLVASTPEPGRPADYLPIAAASNLPLYILQPLNSAKRWHLAELAERLGRGGSTVYAQSLADAADGFQSRPDATEHELALRARLPDLIVRAKRALDRHNGTPRPAVARLPEATEWRAGPLASALQPYPEAPPAPATRLLGLDGRAYDLEDYRGRVVLLNFWATWCPPCVEEIPSLGRLQATLGGRDFVVLGADVGEAPATVQRFLKEVPAAFPVLLDPAGDMVAQWKLRAFPTTFLIDREGRIRYGYFGALEWDDAAVVAVVESLL